MHDLGLVLAGQDRGDGQVAPERLPAVAVDVADRGADFALEAIPADRLGVHGSIVGRLERAGGHATLDTTDGCEWELVVPIR